MNPHQKPKPLSPPLTSGVIVFDKSNPDDDGWVSFDVQHHGGVHDLWIQYTSDVARPLLVKIRTIPMFVPVAFGTPAEHPKQPFLKEGTYDLFEEGITRVGFKPVRADEWPNIRAFQFMPEQNGSFNRRRLRKKQRTYFGVSQSMRSLAGGSKPPQLEDNESPTNSTPRTANIETVGSLLSNASHSHNNPFWWKRSPTAVTFTFEIGMTDVGTDFEYQPISLQGKSLKFTYGAAHDCMALNGDPIGDQYGGENFPQVTRIGNNHVIKSLALGLSTYRGEAAFHSIAFHDRLTRQDEQRVLVGAVLQEGRPGVWVYDREKLGLNLWITSVCAPRNQPVARYGFTLSSGDSIEYNEKEFNIFWEWLVDMKHKMVGNLFLSRDAIAQKMAPLRNFLHTSFSAEKPPLDEKGRMNEGWLYGTNYHVCLTYDVFSLLLYRMPGTDELKTTFFVDGHQYDSSRFERLEEVPLRRNDILAFAIASAAQDTDLLYQMGLLRPSQRTGAEPGLGERELEPLLQTGRVFSGDYSSTPIARRAMVILATAGLYKAGSTMLTVDKFGWDIYSLASQKRFQPDHNDPGSLSTAAAYLSTSDYFKLMGASIVCMLVQILIPALLCYRAIDEADAELTWDTYIARIFFLLYATFAEVSSWGIDRQERVVAWLCFFPEFSAKKLVWGRAVNQLSKVMTTVATIGLVVNSYTVFDVTLNSLALYYLLDLDDNLVDETALERIRNSQEEQYLTIKSKLALEYRQPAFEERRQLPKIQELPARYFLVASRRVGDFSFLMLCGAVMYAIIAPWIISGGGF